MDQNHAPENHELSQSLYRELEALKIRIAFAEISEREMDEFDRELASVVESEYSESAQKRTLKEINRRLNKRLRRRFLRRSLTRTLNVAAVVLLLFFIGLTTATATVQSVRLKLMEFMARLEEQYATVSLEYSENDSVEVPPEWQGDYYLFYVPENFKLDYVDELINSAHYVTKNDQVLDFSELGRVDFSNFDLGHEGVFDVKVNDNEGIAKVEEDGVSITWGIEGTCFSLYFSGEFDEAMRIASNVQFVRGG